MKPQEPAGPQETAAEGQNGGQAPTPTTADDLPVPGDARIRLASLPTHLRAVIREQSEKGTIIAAELPWLAIGTPVQIQSSDGERAGSVQSFDVEVTAAGAARLLIFAAPS